MEKTDIVTMMFTFVLFLMPMWTGTIARIFFKKNSVTTVAVISVVPFFVWRVLEGDHLLALEKAAQMEPIWMKVLFIGICGLFGFFLPYLLAICGVLTTDKLMTMRKA
jgi:hypothetical protein